MPHVRDGIVMGPLPLGRHRQVRVDGGGHGVEILGVDRRPGIKVATAQLAEVSQVLSFFSLAVVVELRLQQTRSYC
jgi:hypothetical protein